MPGGLNQVEGQIVGYSAERHTAEAIAKELGLLDGGWRSLSGTESIEARGEHILRSHLVADAHLVRFETGRLELYNLREDIGEKNNLAGRYPDVVTRIENYLKTARTESQFWSIVD